MSRSNISQAAAASLFAQSTAEKWLVLLAIDFDGTIIRVVNDSDNHVSDGNTYTGYPFQFTLPVESEDDLPSAQLVIDNISHTTFDDGDGGTTGLIYWFRQMTGPIDVTASVVLASDPDTVEVGPITFTLRSITYNADVIEAELGHDPIWDEPFPAFEFTPYYTPGLFTEPSSARARDADLDEEEMIPGGFPAEGAETPRRRRRY